MRAHCPNCGGDIWGDGVRDVLHCELADEVIVWATEPDAAPVVCLLRAVDPERTEATSTKCGVGERASAAKHPFNALGGGN